jgi:hypothetical protein
MVGKELQQQLELLASEIALFHIAGPTAHHQIGGFIRTFTTTGLDVVERQFVPVRIAMTVWAGRRAINYALCVGDCQGRACVFSPTGLHGAGLRLDCFG